MKSVRITMPDDIYETLAREAKAGGYPAISSYILVKIGAALPDPAVERIVNQAIARAAELPINGKPFKLRSLFTKAEWESELKISRINAGRAFFHRVDAGSFGIAASDVTSSNHQTYVRVGGGL